MMMMTKAPTKKPTKAPTKKPTKAPTKAPVKSMKSGKGSKKSGKGSSKSGKGSSKKGTFIQANLALSLAYHTKLTHSSIIHEHSRLCCSNTA
jgi:outer membrane biosynthesis protein TonB